MSSKGIFEPMFDSDLIEEAEDLASAYDDALDSMEDGETFGEARLRARQNLAARDEQRTRHQRRQEMLIVERLIDELPDAAAYIKKRAVDDLVVSGNKIVTRVGVATIQGTEELVIRSVGKVVEAVYRERMNRVATMSKLGRKRPEHEKPRGFLEGPPGFAEATGAEADAANDLFGRLGDKVDAVMAPFWRWVYRRTSTVKEGP